MSENSPMLITPQYVHRITMLNQLAARYKTACDHSSSEDEIPPTELSNRLNHREKPQLRNTDSQNASSDSDSDTTPYSDDSND